MIIIILTIFLILNILSGLACDSLGINNVSAFNWFASGVLFATILMRL